MQQELIQLYNYIKICLYYHHGWEFNRRRLIKDMQHDIFLYLIDKKGKTELTPQVKRYANILSRYYPIYLKNYKYSPQAEQVLLDIDGEPQEPGISYFINGDVLHDLNLIEEAKPKEVLTAKKSISRPVIATYLNGSQEVFDNIELFSKKVGCRLSTAYVWIRHGVPKKRRMLDHITAIKKIEYLV